MDIKQQLEALNEQLRALNEKEERAEKERDLRYKELITETSPFAFVNDKLSFYACRPDGSTVDISEQTLSLSGFNGKKSSQILGAILSIVASSQLNENTEIRKIKRDDPDYFLQLELAGKGFTDIGFRKNRQPVDRYDIQMLSYISSIEPTTKKSNELVQKLNDVNSLQERVSLIEKTAKSLLLANNNKYAAVIDIANKIIADQTLQSLLFDNTSGNTDKMDVTIQNAAYLAIYTEELERNGVAKELENNGGKPFVSSYISF